MNNADVVAERHRTLEGQSLGDYLTVALPMFSMQADILYIEKRRLLPTEEYVLKCVSAGICEADEIGALLGLAAAYAQDLVDALVGGDFLGLTESRSVFMRPKGAAALADDGEERIQERSLPILWDPVSASLITRRVEVVLPRAIRADDLSKVSARRAKAPSPAEISPAELQMLPSRRDEKFPAYQPLRCVGLSKPSLRYRLGVLLVYSGSKSATPVVRVALDGRIDDAYSRDFLSKAVPEALGVDKGFYRRVGTQVVDQRIRKLGVGTSNGGALTLGNLLAKRSSLRFSIDALEKSASPDESVVSRLEARREELRQIDLALDDLPYRSIQPFELQQEMLRLIGSCKKSLTITSTLPVPGKCDTLLLMLLEKAAERDVGVSIFLVGRPEESFIDSKEARHVPLRRFSEIAASHENFRVAFLRESSRTIFECLADESKLLISNEPLLGNRSSPQLLRQFSGFAINSKPVVVSYSTEFLRSEDLVVSDRFRYHARQFPSRKSGASIRQGVPRKAGRNPR